MLVRPAEPDDMEQVLALRHEVFVVDQGVPAELERDELDAVSLHAVACSDGRVVGTGRLVPPGLAEPTATVGRLAVAPRHRRAGVGAAVLAVLEACALERGWPEVRLHAQTAVQDFYGRRGYQAVGDPYEEAGIEHVTMVKRLHDDRPA